LAVTVVKITNIAYISVTIFLSARILMKESIPTFSWSGNMLNN